MKKINYLLLVICCLLLSATSLRAQIIYITPSGTGTQTGASWANAAPGSQLQNKIDGAAANTQVWVAAGTYVPNMYPGSCTNCGTDTRNYAFLLKNNVAIYGGFAGSETALGQRDITANPTVLSGDIGVAGNSNDNCYHVVLSVGNNSTAILNGFTVTGGYGNGGGSITVSGQSIGQNAGGGMVTIGSTSPVIQYCTFAKDTVKGIKGYDATSAGGGSNSYGGAMYNASGASPVITNCIFSDNTAVGGNGGNGTGGGPGAIAEGGGMYNNNASPSISFCRFLKNAALGGTGGNGSGGGNGGLSAGGGIYSSGGSPIITNCTFGQNASIGGSGGAGAASTTGSGGNSFGGGMHNDNALTTVSNCLFYNNNAIGGSCGEFSAGSGSGFGGGDYNYNNSKPITNCTFYGNSANGGNYGSYSTPGTGQGGGIYNISSTTVYPTVTNAVIYGNVAPVSPSIYGNATVSYSLVQDGFAGTANLNADPLFINPTDVDGADNIIGTADDGLTVQYGSPAINSGNNASAAGITIDITGAARIQNGLVDMGAYEKGCTTFNHKIYVDSSVAGSGNGGSWATAFKDLREVLAAKSFCNITIDTILIAKGTYKPTATTNRDSAFAFLNGGLKIYGGYPSGGGTRNITANPTLLSGNIGAANTSSDNSYHVVIINGLGATADSLVLDGLTITGGYANGSGSKYYGSQIFYQSEGGGICISNTNDMGGKIALRNCNFYADTASSNGGALYNRVASPTISNCTFSSNYAGGSAGAMYNYDHASPTISRCTFTNNKAHDAGAIYNFSNCSPSVSNCIFKSNNADNQGGAVYVYDHASPTFNHCFFSQNNAQDGGAIAVFFYSPYSVNDCVFVQNNASERGGALYVVNNCPATLTNCTLVQNNALYGGAMSFNASSNTSIINAIAWGNTATAYPLFYNNAFVTVNYSLMQEGYAGTGNINSDPLFINSANAAGADNIFGTADDGLRLQAGSPAINTGSNAAVPAGVPTDITGAARIQDGTVDMGAYEGSRCPSFTTLYVDSSIVSPGKGGSWATAFKTVQQALDASNSCSGVKQVWIKKGTYYPTAYPTNCTDCAANGTARDYTFSLRDGLALYGGFAGTETDTAQRVASNITVLSGDIGTPNNSSDNCYHVLLAINSSNRLNGLTVTGGNANDNGTITVAGQTIYRSNGGGMYQYATSSALYNCTFTGNTASSEGGGMYNVYGSALRIRNSRYLTNHSGAGGAIRLLYGNTSFVSVNSVYSGNTSSSNDAGALSLVMGSGTDTLINNSFIKNVASGNAANNGGGAIVQESGTSSYIVNNTFYADSAASNGGAIWFKSGGSNRYVYNNIFYKSYNGTANTDISMDGITTITAQSNNLYSNTNPLFINELNPAGADNIFGTADDGLALQSCSPAVNGGSNAAVSQPADIAGQLRIFNGTVDVGAYEYQAIAEGSSLALNGDNGSYNIQAGVNALLIPGCRIIAHILPNSANPLNGSLSAKIWVENTQLVYNGKTYLKRHYELTPAVNAATSSARITLYVTQGELTDFNNIPNKGNSLPAGPNDFSGIANLRIIKFSGQSSNGTGLPGTYSQAGMEINPDDNNIVWNNSLSRWEITFNVTGFSGFFITNNSGILPLTLLQFKGILVNNKDAVLTWRTANEVNTSHFELQRSTDGRSFTAITTIQAKGTNTGIADYGYTDKNLQPGTYYYRLYMIDKDGKATYSFVVTVQFKNTNLLTLYPVPAKDVVWLSGGAAFQTVKNAILMDMQGRVLQSIRITQWPQRIDVSALVPGTYIVKLPEEKGIPFIKQ